MTEARPVARLVQPVFIVSAILVGLLAAIAILGVVLSARSVDYLTQELQPAASANTQVRQAITDMQVDVRSYAFSGDQAQLEAYHAAARDLAVEQDVVASFARDHEELAGLVRRQDDAIDGWIAYADQRLALKPGRLSTRLYNLGVARFHDVNAANQATDSAFDDLVAQAHDDARTRLTGTIIGVALVFLVGGALLLRTRRRLLREISDPLRDLEGVVQRMVVSDPAARAADAGPTEVRAVGHALNDLAASQERARAVEGKIQHELRVLDNARADFVANVSHELRTPLTTLNGYLELVAEEFEGAMDPHHERMVDAARRNVSRLRMLIDDLLTLSKAESTSTDLERVDLSPVVRDVVGDIRLNAARRGITITLERDPKGPALALADKAMLFRAFLNVLTNAVKFSPDNSIVEVSLTTTDTDHVFRVRDHGIGIPATELDQLGTRFFRASNAVAGEIAGTGLGIRIVQTIVDRHAGTFVIDSVEGDGTTVTITVPSQAPATVETPAPATAVDDAVSASS